MSYNNNSAGTITIVDINAGMQSRIDANIVSINIDYSMSMTSELSFDVIDFDGSMYSNNYFQIGSTVVYTTKTGSPFADFNQNPSQSSARNINLIFEIANVTFGPGPGYAPLVQVRCYTKAIQQMRRDRLPGSVSGNGTDFVKRAANKYGLNLFAENTSKQKTINKASGTNQAESLWDVLGNLATEAKFMLFEADGTLFFCSQKFLLSKWGTEQRIVDVPLKDRKPKGPKTKTEHYIPLFFNPKQEAINPVANKYKYFEVLQRPSIVRSDNDPLDATGSAVISRKNGTLLRPGMTIEFFDFDNDLSLLNPITATTDGLFLIDTVSFQDKSTSPVQISFRKPEKKPKDIRQVIIGKRYKFSNNPNNIEELNAAQLDKNGKVIRPKTPSQKARINLDIPTSEMPTNLKNDNLVNPLPNRENRYRLPRDPLAIAINTSTSGSISLDMYSRPIVETPSGGISSLAPMVVNNVVEPGVFGGLPFSAVIPRVLVNQSTNEPYFIASASAASVAFIENSANSASPVYLAKFADATRAEEYKRLCNLQQTLIIGQRFQNRVPPVSYIYPLPTSASVYNYPNIEEDSGLIEKGNIDLYNLPVKIIEGEPRPFFPYICTAYKEPNNNVSRAASSMVLTSGYATLTIPNTNTELYESSASVSITNTYMDGSNSSSVLFPSTWPTSTSSVAFSKISGFREILSASYSLSTTTLSIGIDVIPSLVSSSVTISSPHANVSPVTYNNNPYVLVLNGLWTQGSKTFLLTKDQALSKYYADGYFFARCQTYQDAQNYIELLIEQQFIVLKNRFPSGIQETL